MKRYQQLAAIIIISVAVFQTGCDTGSTSPEPAVALKIAPQFDLEILSGGRAKLADYRGKIIILDFWATWCPPCIKGIPDFVELQKKYGNKGLAILGISLDQNPKQKLGPFVKKYKMNYPVLLTDGKVDRAYGGITGIPTTFVINRKGEIYKKYVGLRPKKVFEADIKALLN